MTKQTTPPQYHVVFRTCDVVNAVNSPRPFGVPKRELIQVCFLSLWTAIKNFPHSIHILGDKISPELTTYFELFQKADPSISISHGDYGNDESIRQSLSRAFERPDNEWVYLCEDDYLHTPESFAWMNELIERRTEVLNYVPRRSFFGPLFGDVKSKPLILHPADCPDRYRADQKTLSFLFLTRFNHWRQIANTTFTLLAEAKTFRRYRWAMMKSSQGANDDFLSHWVMERLPWRGRALCLSPIPGVATHLHNEVMTPLVDWDELHRRYRAEAASIVARGRV